MRVATQWARTFLAAICMMIVFGCESKTTPPTARPEFDFTGSTLLTFSIFPYATPGLNDPQELSAQAQQLSTPGPFVYYWSVANCPANISEIDCEPVFTNLSDHTSNPVKLPRQPRGPNGTKVWVAAQVVDSAADATGADTVIYIIQPTPHGVVLYFKCDPNSQTAYGFPFPFHDDSGSYRRNACTGLKNYQH